MLGELVVCAGVSPHLQILLYFQMQCYLPPTPRTSASLNCGDFSNGAGCMMKMKIRTAKSNLDAQQDKHFT